MPTPKRGSIQVIFTNAPSGLRNRIVGLYGLLIAFNLAAWGWAFWAFRHHPVLLGTALMAYGFGLRHAVDADHITAIDNATRKLMQQGKRPVSLGLMFSLGHSTIVVLLSIAVAAGAVFLKQRSAAFQDIGSLVGTLVSAGFMLLIAMMNLVILVSVYRTFRQVRRGGAYREDDLDALLANRGLLARLFRPLMKLVSRSWHLYLLGLLFGLGFDTATEIGLLGISATSAAQGMSAWNILVFPALFTAGMTLVDTTDSILMLGAYGWAFIKPIRKLYYNLTLTFISVIIALAVGGIEALGLLAERLQLNGHFWSLITSLNHNFGTIGYAIIALFLVSWLLSAAIYKWRRYDEIEV